MQNRPLKALRLWLYLIAAVQASAIVAVWMPTSWIDQCALLMGVEPLPHSPLAGYLARLSSLMYVVHGATVFIVSYHLPRSLFLVPYLGWLTGFAGVGMLTIDIAERMPAMWTCVEFGALTFNGLVIVLLSAWCDDVINKVQSGP